jgi:DNA polymerase-3 subunit beta
MKAEENSRIFLSDGVANFRLAYLPADEYPVFFEPEGVINVELQGEMLAEMIDKTIYSVTLEDAGFKLSGVFVQKVAVEGRTLLRMVATDGHRLSLVDKSFEGVERLEIGNGVMIPKKAMVELNKLASDGGSIQLGFKQNNCVARKEDTVLVIRLLEAKFPDYHAVIPKKIDHRIEMNRVSLIEAMRKMLILSNERYRAVKISLENDTMELVSTNPDLGEARENIQIDYGKDRLEMGFNARYFIDALQSMESEVVVMGFIDSSKPCVLEGEVDQGFLGLIMPMRL